MFTAEKTMFRLQATSARLLGFLEKIMYAVISQKISPEYGLFHSRTNKLVSEQPPAQVNFSRGGAKGWDLVANGAGKGEVGRPGPA